MNILLVAFLAFLVAACIQPTTVTLAAPEESACLKLLHCSLVEADLKNSTSNIKSKYSAATGALAQYNTFLISKEPKITKLCADRLKNCGKSASLLAEKKFNFPAKYLQSCDFNTFSKSIFGCTNKITWPAAIKKMLPVSSLDCKTDCTVNEPKPIMLRNGKYLQDNKYSRNESPEMRATGEADTTGYKRPMTLHGGFSNSSGWEPLTQCSEGWVSKGHGHNVYRHPESTPLVEFWCYTTAFEHVYTIFSDPAFNKNNERKYQEHECPQPKYVVALKMIMSKKNRKLSRYNVMCTGEVEWHFKGGKYNDAKNTYAITLSCPNGTAICAIQGLYRGGNKNILEDLRIGCCGGDPAVPDRFINTLPASPASQPSFCSAPNPSTTCSCEGCRCCTAVDSSIEVSTAHENFQFPPSVPHAIQIQVLAAVVQQLSPSKYTKLNWEKTINQYYKSGKNETAPPAPTKTGKAMTESWIKYSAICNGVNVTFYDGPTLVPYPNCTYFGNCPNSTLKCKSIADEWFLAAQHRQTFGRAAEGDEGYRKEMNITRNKTPVGDRAFERRELIHELTNKLSPSKSTGFNWGEQFRKKGPLPDTYTVRLGDVPEGMYMNIYQIMAKCDEYTVLLPVFRKILYKEKDKASNCQLAKSKQVSLEGLDGCK